MKTRELLPELCLLALCLMGIALSCRELADYGDSPKTGEILMKFVSLPEMTKSSSAIPDTNSFILSVVDSKGGKLYEGPYGAAPTTFLASAGSYTVSVRSRDFLEPLFDAPQYGDEQVVTVSAGSVTSVLLTCSQLNAGMRIFVDDSFKVDYPEGVLYLKAPGGKLMYSYEEKRIAYFSPGVVSLVLFNAGSESTLFSRSFAQQQMLSLRLSSASAGVTGGGADNPSKKPGMRIQVDTCRFWMEDGFELGGTNPGEGKDRAFSVGEARERAGETDVWVYGYIVGGDLSSSKCSFDGPFSSRTNLVISSKSSCRDKESCLSVQLSKGDIRDALNLVDHEDNLGRQVFLRGNLVEAYYGIPGIQSLSEFELR